MEQMIKRRATGISTWLALIGSLSIGCSGVSPAPIRTTDETGHFINAEDGLPFEHMWRGGQDEGPHASLEGRLEISDRCVYVYQSHGDDYESKIVVSMPWMDTRYDPSVPAIATRFYVLSSSGNNVTGGGGYNDAFDFSTSECSGDSLFRARSLGPVFHRGGPRVPELYVQYQRRWNPTDRRLFPTPR